MGVTVTALGMSTRGRGEGRVVEAAAAAESVEDLKEMVRDMSKTSLSNSEVMALFGVYGALEEGADVRYINLAEHLPKNEADVGPELRSYVESIIRESDGLILSTPVYFGDRSSYLNTFFNVSRNLGERPLEDMSIGVLSVGAKRNGGQETTNIYTLYDSVSLGGIGVGNGPPTSQYGGTGWGGDLGSVAGDDFGLMTARGTGRRVAEVAGIVDGAKRERPTVLFVSTTERSDAEMDGIRAELEVAVGVETRGLRLRDHRIDRCIGCKTCPNGDDTGYRCIVQDDMEHVETELEAADAIVMMGASFGPSNVYQAFMERTRYLRRDDFRLRNTPYTALACSDHEGDIFPLRAMTSLIRHNTMYLGPPTRIGKGARDLSSLKHFTETTARITDGKQNVSENRTYEYVAVGYEGRR